MVHVCLKTVDLSPNYGHFIGIMMMNPWFGGTFEQTQAGVGQGNRKKHARFG